MDADWYDLSTKAIGFLWSLIGLVCVFLGLIYANDPTANDTFFLHPGVAVLLVYAGNVILLGGLSLAFLFDEVIQKRDTGSIGGYALFVIGSFVLLFGILSLTEPESFLHPQLSYPVSLAITVLGIVGILLGMVFLSSPEPMTETVFSLFEFGLRTATSLSFIIIVGLLLFVVYSLLIILTSQVLALLLVTAAAVYVLRGTNLETGDQVALVVFVVVLALAGSVLVAGSVITPSYDNTTMTVGPEEPPCVNSYNVTFDEKKFDLGNETVGNYTKERVKEIVLKDLGLEGNSLYSKRESDELIIQLDFLIDKLGAEGNLTANEEQILYSSFRDALVFEATGRHYPHTEIDVASIPDSTNINETLRIVEEEYGIKDPKLVDQKPRRIKFAKKTINVEKRYNPDRYYIITGDPDISSHGYRAYADTSLIIVRNRLFLRDTRLVQFKKMSCN